MVLQLDGSQTVQVKFISLEDGYEQKATLQGAALGSIDLIRKQVSELFPIPSPLLIDLESKHPIESDRALHRVLTAFTERVSASRDDAVEAALSRIRSLLMSSRVEHHFQGVPRGDTLNHFDLLGRAQSAWRGLVVQLRRDGPVLL
eukprot:6188900-Pleurochrysis_carterae.AAC.2